MKSFINLLFVYLFEIDPESFMFEFEKLLLNFELKVENLVSFEFGRLCY